MLQPVSPLAGDIARFFNGMMILSYVIFGLVAVLIAYALLHYRARPGRAETGAASRPHTILEVAWTVLPLLTVGVIFFFTIRIMYSTEPDSVPVPEIKITGRQWWWQAQYSNGAYAANEIHIPTGRRVPVWILTGDVIHDFWVPELGPKIDAIPGRANALWLEADKPGTYFGACAEYCGNQHAWMLIRVIAQTPDVYVEWLKAQAASAAQPDAGDAGAGAQLFQQRSCVNCHAIQGTDANARVGPDLTHVASRSTLGAGVLRNTPENLARWMQNPQLVKPGILMPNFKFSRDQVRQITAYLETLR